MRLITAMLCAVLLTAVTASAAQCAATTKKGTQCSRKADAGSAYCWQHKPKEPATAPATKTTAADRQ